jgi:tRNA pseudouridine38/39 synthase
MAAVLMMVGKGLEDPSIVPRLLDVEQTPCKPQYHLAPEVRPPVSAQECSVWQSALSANCFD